MLRNSCIHTIENSVIQSDIELITPLPWNETICQDIHHSIYGVHETLKSKLQEWNPFTEKMLDPEYIFAQYVVTSLTRPFCITWHAAFFKNQQYAGLQPVISKPIRTVRKEVRSMYRIEVLELKSLLGSLCLRARDDEWLKSQKHIWRPDLYAIEKAEGGKDSEEARTDD